LDKGMQALWSGIRRLRAAFSFARRSQTRLQSDTASQQQQPRAPTYHIPYQRESLTVTSIVEFDTAAMTLLVWELAHICNAGESIPLAEKQSGLPPFNAYAELRKAIAERVIPDERDEDGLVALLSFDSSFLMRRAPYTEEEMNEEETTTAALVHRGLAEHIEAVLEAQWDRCVRLTQAPHSAVWAICLEILSNTDAGPSREDEQQALPKQASGDEAAGQV
jgi:hypothetical protein